MRSSWKIVCAVFLGLFVLGSLAIPIVINDDHRILPDMPNKQFVAIGLVVSAGYAAFLTLAGFGGRTLLLKHIKKDAEMASGKTRAQQNGADQSAAAPKLKSD